MPEAAPPSTAEPVIVRGTCRVMLAFDVGMAIDVDAAEGFVGATAAGPGQRETIRRSRRGPRYFEYSPAPLRVTLAAEPIALGEFRTSPRVDCVMYDFGAMSVTYEIPIVGALERVLALSEAIYDNERLLRDALARVDEILGMVSAAITRPHLSDFAEDYAVYEIAEVADGAGPGRLIAAHPALLAGILRADARPLSEQALAEALASRLSYSPSDTAIVDWNAAILFDAEPEDARAVLEFANVELLEMRHLDDRLDAALEEAYAIVSGAGAASGPRGGGLERVAELQLDSSILFENVNNALKLLGDQYLARLYRLAAARLHLPEWDASILRKLATLESIYEKLSDRHTHRRMQTLELIVIVLIAVEIVLSLIRY